MPGIYQAVSRHRLQNLFAFHSVQDPISLIALQCLYGVHTAFCQMQSHRPVIRDCIDHVSHASVQSSLSRPDMRADKRDLLGNIPKDRCHDFGIFLV